MAPREHQQLMTAAVAQDAEGQRALLAGHPDAARAAFAAAAELYQRSWEVAHATAYGRLVGMLKSAVLAGDGLEQASYVRRTLAEADPSSATASYARALAALILDEDAEAKVWAARMGADSEAFARAGQALEALAARDRDRFAEALVAIVRDFEQRAEHLTGVSIADTALVFSALAARRGTAVRIESPVLPAR